jgi:hypothetical protein
MNPHWLPLLLAYAFLSSCVSPDQRREQLQRKSRATGVCAVHHVKLKDKICYGPAGLVIFERSIYDEWNRHPIAVNPFFTEKKTASNPYEVKIFYCEICERQFSEVKKARYPKAVGE